MIVVQAGHVVGGSHPFDQCSIKFGYCGVGGNEGVELIEVVGGAKCAEVVECGGVNSSGIRVDGRRGWGSCLWRGRWTCSCWGGGGGSWWLGCWLWRGWSGSSNGGGMEDGGGWGGVEGVARISGDVFIEVGICGGECSGIGIVEGWGWWSGIGGWLSSSGGGLVSGRRVGWVGEMAGGRIAVEVEVDFAEIDVLGIAIAFEPVEAVEGGRWKIAEDVVVE